MYVGMDTSNLTMKSYDLIRLPVLSSLLAYMYCAEMNIVRTLLCQSTLAGKSFNQIIISLYPLVRTVLLAIIGFMPTKGEGAIGSLDYTPDERKVLARK